LIEHGYGDKIKEMKKPNQPKIIEKVQRKS